ncbi:MAG: oligosaccharide flippase family protein [Betaproteobacteria bacterium]|nr:oligosaccharide flippase family protein [Betaproteobacteria bacterium]
MSSSGQDIGRFAKHSAIYAIGNALNRVGAFLMLPIYTNFLSTAEYGVLELFYAVAMVISGVLSVGLSHATLRFYFDYDDEGSRRALVSTNLLASLALGALGAGVIALWHAEIARMLFPNNDYSRGVLLILIILVFELSSEICQAYVRARENSLLFVGISAARLAVQLIANSLLVVVFHAGAEGVLLGNLCAVAAGWAILFFHTTRHCGFAFHLDKLLPVLRYSAPFLLTTIVGIIAGNVDRFLINGMLTLQALGIYALATKFSKLLSEMIGEPFNRAYGAYRFSIMDTPDAAAIQARLVRYLLAGASIAGLGILLFTRDLLVLMSHRDFWPAADILPLLVLAAIINLVCYPVQSGILFKKRSDEIFYIGVANALLRAVGGFALISWFGLLGACASVLLAATVTLVLTDRIAQRFFAVGYEFRRLAGIVLLGVLFYLVSLPFTHLPWPVALLAKSLLFLGYVASLLGSTIFDKEETAYATAFLRRKLLPGGAKDA